MVLAHPVPASPSAGRPQYPNMSTSLAAMFTPTPTNAMIVTGRGRDKPSTKLRSAANPRNGRMPHRMASRYAVAPSIVAGSCPVHRSTGSMVLRIKRTTAPSPPASQSPCRTLRPAAAGASAPTACDTIGPTARTIPMPMIAKKKKTVCPSATPASASGPKRPTITVSTKLIEMCASWAATTGPARRRVARNSRYRAAENTEVADRENA
ncbi:hypothetical protein SARU107417_07490 [Salinibacter ruber]